MDALAIQDKYSITVSKKDRFDIELLSRKLAYEYQRDLISTMMNLEYDDGAHANGKGIMIQFNKKTKEAFGHSCDEIDKIADIAKCQAVRMLREDAIRIISDYLASWDNTGETYKRFKHDLWLAIEAAKVGYQAKCAVLGGAL